MGFYNRKYSSCRYSFIISSLRIAVSLNRLLSISRRIWPVGLLDIVLNFGISLIIAYLLGLSLMSALIISV